MKATEAQEIFQAMAVANGHPNPAAYAAAALEAWKNPPPAAAVQAEPEQKEGE